MWYFCTVLLGFTSPGRTLGWFGASHRTLMALHSFVSIYLYNLLPSISRCVGPAAQVSPGADGPVAPLRCLGRFALPPPS